jgi:hypothetical protein
MSRPALYSTTLAAMLVATAWATPARATGYWNMPSNFCQCLGYGFGAGHHAPLVLGPANWNGICAHNEVRLPCAPSVPYGSCGSTDGRHYFAHPSLLEPAPAAAAPAPVPLTRRPRPLFLR